MNENNAIIQAFMRPYTNHFHMTKNRWQRGDVPIQTKDKQMKHIGQSDNNEKKKMCSP